MSTSVIVPAAGSGVRLGENRPKAFVDLGGGRSILWHTVSAICTYSADNWFDLDRIIVVVPADLMVAARSEAQRGADEAGRGTEIVVVPGGAERSDSVRAGLAQATGDFVLVHDAARPFTPAGVFERVLEALRDGHPVVVPGLPVVDTLKRVDETPRVVQTVDRSVLRAIQTPQGFGADALARAYSQAGDTATDDAGLAERAGLPVYVVDGDPLGFKITTPWDLRLARTIAKGLD